jgi:hypothetical protein
MIVHSIRRFVHRRYVRAVAVALSLTAIFCTASFSALAIRHQVSVGAVARYFLRAHARQADLSHWIQTPAAAAELERLFAPDLAMNPGGFVYLEGGSLRFLPHQAWGGPSSRERQSAREALFLELTPLYFTSDVEGLIGEMAKPFFLRHLGREGIHPREVRRLQESLAAVDGARDRRLLLRRAASLLQRIAPYQRGSYRLSLGEALRFHDSQRPSGRYVGVFEVHGISLAAAVDAAHAAELGARSHYLAISRSMDGMILVEDFYRGEVRRYRIRPFRHPSGRTLYKVTRTA